MLESWRELREGVQLRVEASLIALSQDGSQDRIVLKVGS